MIRAVFLLAVCVWAACAQQNTIATRPPRPPTATAFWGRTQGCLPLDQYTAPVLCSDVNNPLSAAQFCLTMKYCQCRNGKWAVTGRTTFFGATGSRALRLGVYTVKTTVFNAVTKAVINGTAYANCPQYSYVNPYSSMECDYRAIITPPNNGQIGVYPSLNTACFNPNGRAGARGAEISRQSLTVLPADGVISQAAGDIAAQAVTQSAAACDPTIC